MDTKRNIFLWILYDFANSILSIVFFLYFAQWIVVDKGISDLYFNLSFAASALLLLFTVPLTGSMLDKSMRRISGIRYTTTIAAILYGLCALSAVMGRPVIALIIFAFGLYVYLLSFTFYTPLIKDIAPKNKLGFISGLGVAANYLGQITGLLIALPFSTGKISLFQSMPRAETLLPAVIIFSLLAIPMLIFFREPKRVVEKTSLRSKLQTTIKESKLLFSVSSFSFFLLAFFLFNDAILTAANNFPIFLEQVWQVSDTIKTYVMLGILITSAIGGTCAGLVADKYGHKRTLMCLLAGWMIILPFIGLLTNFVLFIIATTLLGFWYGANWAVARSVMSYVAPKKGHNLAFSYYGLAERASSFVGPIVWGLIVSSLVSLGSVRYRIALCAMAVFTIAGLFALSKVRDDRTAWKATEDEQEV